MIMQYRNQQLITQNGHVRFSRNGNGIDQRSPVLWNPAAFFTTKDFKERVQTLDTAITGMSACSVNYWLLK